MKKIQNIIHIVKSLEDSGYLGKLLGTLGASLLRNTLAGKGFIRASEETKTARQEQGVIPAGEGATRQKHRTTRIGATTKTQK